MLTYLESKESQLDHLGEQEMKTAASRARKRGVDNLLYSDRQVEYALNAGFSTGGVTPTASPVVAHTSSIHPLGPSPSNHTITNTPSKAQDRRMQDVEREHDRYVGQGTWEDIGGIDLVKHWTVSDRCSPIAHCLLKHLIYGLKGLYPHCSILYNGCTPCSGLFGIVGASFFIE